MFKNHIEYDIKTKADLLNMIKLFKEHKPQVSAFDTETTGLNIGLDTPFLFQFGWVYNDSVYSFAVDIEEKPKLGKETVWSAYKLVSKIKYFIGHNIKYDLHMCHNIGFDYDTNNLLDTQCCIRLAHDALTPENGGPPLGLKEYASQYINKSARDHERLLKTERTNISKDYNAHLIKALRLCSNPPAGFKSWTKGALETFFKDKLKTGEDLPTEEMRKIYREWYASIPSRIKQNMKTPFVESEDIPYDFLNREAVIRYAHKDIYYTLAVYYKTMPVIEARKNLGALKIECDVILPLYYMEATGFKIDKDYVLKTKTKMYNYIKRRRQDLFDLVNEDVSVGQHKRIKELLQEKWGLTVVSTGNDELGILIPKLKREGYTEAVEFISTVQELRTLEKWYTTYLLRFINELKRSDRIYTQINQAGTVSGRVTSDFQQFPKYGIRTIDDESLFNPRDMVIKSEDSVGLFYLDYSQIELRLQALYTILVGSPDLNLCRAYMPYECSYIVDDGDIGCGQHQYHFEKFDYNNPEHIAHAYDWKWYYNEDLTKEWVKTDVHAATTAIAFPDLDPNSEEFHKYRGKVGKRVNFAKNYGAQYSKISTMFPEYNFTEEQLHKIDDAYYKAFPGVKKYHEYCYELASAQVYATNLFGVRYYGLSGHKLINCLVQGSGAYFLKLKMIAVCKYLKEHNCKSRFQMNIHDEMSFELVKGEENIIFDIQKIMQEYDDGLVPIVADLEVTNSSWANKVECETMEDVKAILYRTVQTEN